MKRQQQSISPNVFLKLPLSEAVLWVIDDIKSFKAKGVDIDMSTWFQSSNDKKLCSVCAGGAAVLGFLNKKQIDMLMHKKSSKAENKFLGKMLNVGVDQVTKIETTFDNVRSLNYHGAVNRWKEFIGSHFMPDTLYDDLNDLYVKHEAIADFNGVLNKKTLKVLIKQMKEFSKLLKKHNY